MLNKEVLINIFKKLLEEAKNSYDNFNSAEDFKGKKIKIGRARMFEDKTMYLDDPGMFALNRLSSIFQIMKTLIVLALVIVIGWVLFRPFSKSEIDRYNDRDNWPNMDL